MKSFKNKTKLTKLYKVKLNMNFGFLTLNAKGLNDNMMCLGGVINFKPFLLFLH